MDPLEHCLNPLLEVDSMIDDRSGGVILIWHRVQALVKAEVLSGALILSAVDELHRMSRSLPLGRSSTQSEKVSGLVACPVFGEVLDELAICRGVDGLSDPLLAGELVPASEFLGDGVAERRVIDTGEEVVESAHECLPRNARP